MAERKEKEDEKPTDQKVEIIRYIPSDIVKEILYKLPCKPLVKFMSTCKLWHSLAADRRAVTNPSHFLISDRKHGRIHLYSLDDDSFIHVTSFVPASLDCRLARTLPSCYGLTCGVYSLDYASKKQKIIVFNPITQQTITLTAMPPNHDPQNYSTGFGFDPRTNQYKVIVLLQSIVRGGIISGHILMLQPGRSIWRPIISHSTSSTQDSERLLGSTAVCTGGVVYWESRPRYSGRNFDILSLDLQSEELQWIISPRIPECDRIGDPFLLHEQLISLQEKLCSVEVSFDCHSSENVTEWRMDIWMLVDSSRGDWTPLHRLDFEFEFPSTYVFPVCIRRGNVIVRRGRSMFYSYNIEEKSLRVLKGEHPTGCQGYGVICGHAETSTSFNLMEWI